MAGMSCHRACYAPGARTAAGITPAQPLAATATQLQGHSRPEATLATPAPRTQLQRHHAVDAQRGKPEEGCPRVEGAGVQVGNGPVVTRVGQAARHRRSCRCLRAAAAPAAAAGAAAAAGGGGGAAAAEARPLLRCGGQAAGVDARAGSGASSAPSIPAAAAGTAAAAAAAAAAGLLQGRRGGGAAWRLQPPADGLLPLLLVPKRLPGATLRCSSVGDGGTQLRAQGETGTQAPGGRAGGLR